MKIKNNKDIFTSIFKTNHWKSKESFSGPGSEIRQTKKIRRTLPILFKKYNIKTILDIPCGDFNWMKIVDMSSVNKYIGADIVSEIIKINNAKYKNDQRKFIELDIIKDKLPKVDLIFSRDCFVHLKNNEIKKALKNIKASNSTFLLTTTYILKNINNNTNNGKWRPVNLNIKPFNLPKYIKYINTDFRNNNKNHPGNGMALWKISEI